MATNVSHTSKKGHTHNNIDSYYVQLISSWSLSVSDWIKELQTIQEKTQTRYRGQHEELGAE